MTALVHPGDAMSRGQRILHIILLGALVGLGPFTIDLYLPAFPKVVDELSTTDAAVQLTLTATTVGFGLGQLVVGPWSDRVGRRLPLLLATALHIGASIGVAASPDVVWVGVFRVLQGIGAAGGGVVAMAMVRDLFSGHALVRMLSRLALVTGLAPILAPLIGSQMLLFFDWRGIFVALAIYGFVAVVVAAFLVAETRPRGAHIPSATTTARQRYRALFTDRVFIGVAIIGGMQFSGLFAYLSASSLLLQNVYGLSAQQFGIMFGVNSLGLVIASQLSSRLMRRIGPQWILATAIGIMLLSSLSIAVVALLGGALIPILVALFVMLAACGLAFPSVQVLALAHHGSEAGTAASLLGAVNFGLAGVISPIVGVLGITSALPMAAVMIGCHVVANVVMWTIVRPRTVPPIE
ncbi:multidrug effflux MFS transporter [Schumannella luteola]|uniref:DHA1 family bicyclomycin/chloramphenicol resistance-like MFS transporter n=1 Tax=Schumannella luteola TaxID=472059 RepID=A0A852Y6L0_9MICO|nr:multidrug effflux MFS transporter [Schumannella luteola]NYG98596.1 DHA1 family bicyclomycin/chloramphenicol resistance-like MFS transporter [Schumannella luteola]TPX02572.1 multidrug effflux MFS transporter [Schumannella luteola]